MNNLNSSQIGNGSPLTDQECLQLSWEPVKEDAEKKRMGLDQ